MTVLMEVPAQVVAVIDTGACCKVEILFALNDAFKCYVSYCPVKLLSGDI